MKEKVLRVLLVDDDNDALTKYKDMFERRGFKVSLAYSVSEAMCYLYNKMELGIHYAAVMSDFDLENPQDGSGLKLLEAMRKDTAFRDTFFILYTARTIKEEGIARIIAADKRATHFLKPKDMNKVIIPFILGELECTLR